MIEEFRKAIEHGNVAAVRRILETDASARASVNAPLFAFDQRPVSRAARNLEMVDVLLEFGADLNQKSGWWAGGWGILETAAPEIAEELIKRGAVLDVFSAAHLNKLDRLLELLDAEPELVHAKGGDGCRPLHFASSGEAMDLLLSRGAQIDARDVDHEATAAQWAIPWIAGQSERDEAWRGTMERMRRLVSRGAMADIFMAAALGDVGILNHIIGHDPTAIGRMLGGEDYPLCPKAPGQHIYIYRLAEGITPYQVAMEFGNSACAELLMASATMKQRFLTACSVGDEAAARAVLAKEPGVMADVSPRDQALLPAAAWSGKLTAVRLMLDLGMDPGAKGPGESTALHRAAWRGHAEIVRLILSHPAAKERLAELVNSMEVMHKATPLSWCYHGSVNCRNPKGDYPRIAPMLLEAGANPATDMTNASEEVRAMVGTWQRHTH